MLRRIGLLLFILLVASWGLAGCGEPGDDQKPDSQSKETQGQLDPAALLTKADAQEILQEEVKEAAITSNSMGQQICFYEPEAEGTAVRCVQLAIISSADMTDKMKEGGYNAARLYEDSLKLLEDAQEIKGLGEKAFWGGSGLKMGAGLHVLEGDVYFSIIVALGEEEADLQAAKKLAPRVLKKI